MSALLLASAPCRTHDESRPLAPGEERSGLVSAEVPSAAEIRAALLAVEYWSDPERPELPDPLRPIPLERAAEILAADAERGPFGRSRRNRAIITLTVEGLSLDPEGRPVHAHRAALDILGAPLPKIDAAIREIAAAFPAPAGPPLEPADFGLLAWIRKQLAPALSQNVPALAPLSVGSCNLIGTPTTSVSMVSTDPWGTRTANSCSLSPAADAVVVANTFVVVSRRFDELSQLMDPQNWDAEKKPPDRCNVYFEKTEVLEANAGCDGNPIQCPPLPGSEWKPSPQPLREHYRMAWDPWSQSLETRVETVLSIATDLEPDTASTKFRADYSLKHHCATNIGADKRGRIAVDEGYTRVIPDGTGTVDRHIVQSEKQVAFAGWKDAASRANPNPEDWSPYYNGLACYSLEAMGRALQEFVCCDVPAPVSCTPPAPVGQPVLIP